MDPDPDADPDPVIYVRDLQNVNKKFFFAYFCLLNLFITFLKVHLNHFSKIKSHKEVTKQ